MAIVSAYRAQAAVAALLLLQSALLAYAAYVHSPVVDETAHLPAGILVWTRGRTDVYAHNPPLVKAIAALPVLAVGYGEDWGPIDERPLLRPEFEWGRRFATANGPRIFWLFTLARWACLPFAALGGWVVWRWARDLYGGRGGPVALLLWCFSPDVLGNGYLITPDLAATSCGLLACWLFWRWLRAPGWPGAAAAGAGLGLALLCKYTWLLLPLLWPALWLAWRVGERVWPDALTPGPSPGRRGENSRRELGQMGVVAAVALFVVCAGYGFRGVGRPLGEFDFYSAILSGQRFEPTTTSAGGNRLAGTWLGNVPVPAPADFLLGVDRQKHDLERGILGYLLGEWKQGGWWYFYLYGLAVKLPLGTWLLLGVAVATAVARRPAFSRDEALLLAFPAAVLALVSAETGIHVFLRYALPAQPFLFVFAGRAGAWLSRRTPWRAALAGAGLAWSVGSSLAVFPYSASYFNEWVGGPRGGPDHFVTANVGWGQDLLFLARWVAAHPEARPLGLAYYGNLDPRLAGLEFELPPTGPHSANFPCARNSARQGPLPGWFAVDVSFTRGLRHQLFDGHGQRLVSDEPNCEYSYFKRFEPVATAGYSIYVYRITTSQADQVRAELGLPTVASEE